MNKIKLPNVTLLGIDCVNAERLAESMDICQKDIDFGASKLLTHFPIEDKRLIKIHSINSIEEYSRFCIEDLVKYVDTDFVLIVQYDGFVLNPQSWSDDFLQYDYIGAPWLVGDWSIKKFAFPESMRGKIIVGNGGFCLRSKKFLEISSKLARAGQIPNMNPEDVAMCVWYKDIFEKEGIKFAPPEVAEKFSIEGRNHVYKDQFGFHGFGWTDISLWINNHPEYKLAYDNFRRMYKPTHPKTHHV